MQTDEKLIKQDVNLVGEQKWLTPAEDAASRVVRTSVKDSGHFWKQRESEELKSSSSVPRPPKLSHSSSSGSGSTDDAWQEVTTARGTNTYYWNSETGESTYTRPDDFKQVVSSLSAHQIPCIFALVSP